MCGARAFIPSMPIPITPINLFREPLFSPIVQPKADSGREGKMYNQHVGLTGVLAEQRMTERHQQATHEQLLRSARLPRRRRQQTTRRWWQLVLRPMGA